MKKKIIASMLVGTLLSTTGFAEIKPQPYPTDTRITRVAYQDNNVVPIKAQTFISTQIVFASNEQIINVDGGDRAGWITTYYENIPNMLFVKPTVLKSNTNLSVVTNRHNYYFHLTSNRNLARIDPPIYAIKFYYPDDERKQLNASKAAQARHRAAALASNKAPKSYNWNYSFHGAGDLKPVHVFDDGVFTYFELHPNQPVPAIFIVDNQKGEEAVGNIRRQGAYLVVHRTSPQFTLRLGKNQVASVFNNLEIARIKGGRTA